VDDVQHNNPNRLGYLSVLVTVMTLSCAGDFVNHRFDLPISSAIRLEVRDSSGAVVRSITDAATIRTLDVSADRIDRWFDDIFGGPKTPDCTVDLFGEREWIGTLTIFPRRIHYVPGKGGAKVSLREHDELLRILGSCKSAHAPD
jgi:hypothetical protein